MARCPSCQLDFGNGEQFCPRDGSPLSSEPALGDPFVGRVLGGRYRLAERLGQGGMGAVYRAVHTLMDKPLAVKILRAELATDADAVARFHREARSASRLDHDHCIRVTDFGQSEDGLLYLAMELLEGQSLTRRMREGRVTVAEACRLAHSIALALEHAHEAGVVHRDLKPDNVFLARRPRGREVVKVLDFGLAKLASDSSKSRSITRDGTIFGTPEYMAPEQAQGDPLDKRTDLYSLGVLLYHLVTGELPFSADTFVALLTKHVRETARPPRDLDPTIPPELEAIVLRCMMKRPADRYASASELAEALLPFAARGESTGQVAPVAAAPSGPTDGPDAAPDAAIDALLGRSRRTRRVALAAVLLGIAAAGALGARALGPHGSAGQVAGAAEPANELGGVRRLIDGGRLEEAAALLDNLHRRGETAALERATSEVAERRGRRLDALAHLHRAKTLAPADPGVRAALAGLLLRLGQKVDGCRQAARALELATANADLDTAGRARGMLKDAACAAP